MWRGIWTRCVLLVMTLILAPSATVVVLLFPRLNDFSMRAAKVWSRALLRATGARVHYEGLEHVRDAPRVYIANHQSMVDIWALISILPRSTRFVAKRELFRIPVFGWLLRTAEFTPVDRSNRAEAIRSLSLAAERVRAGRSIVLFPEGTRSRDGQLRPFKKGAFYLALAAGVPVVPVAITGSFDVMPPGSLRVYPGDVRVRFQPEIDVAVHQPDDHAGLQARVRSAVERGLQAQPS
jgi:1-acyl-sn-glycerol-3-phosphate acyltransferase